jgi:hypothetical protein
MQACRINIADELSSDLAFRDIAASFMDKVESQRDRDVIIDFRDVESITRSFAHEYVNRRDITSKNIVEVNVPPAVTRMFAVINNSEKRPRFDDLKNAELLSI